MLLLLFGQQAADTVHPLGSITLNTTGKSVFAGATDTDGLLARIQLAGVGQRSLGTRTFQGLTTLTYPTEVILALDSVTLDATGKQTLSSDFSHYVLLPIGDVALDVVGRSALTSDIGQSIGLGDLTIDATGKFAPEATVAIEAVHTFDADPLATRGESTLTGDPVASQSFFVTPDPLAATGQATLTGDFSVSTYVAPQPEEPATKRGGGRLSRLRPITDAHVVLRGVSGKIVAGRLQAEGLVVVIDAADVRLRGVAGRGQIGTPQSFAVAHSDVRLTGVQSKACCGPLRPDADVIVLGRVDPSLDCEVNPTFRNIGRGVVGRLKPKGVKNPTEEELILLIAAASRPNTPMRLR